MRFYLFFEYMEEIDTGHRPTKETFWNTTIIDQQAVRFGE